MSRPATTQAPEVNLPIHTIDLSLPPRERYKALAHSYKDQLQNLTSLFDSLLADLGIAERYRVSINRLARLLLRGVNSSVETAELRGISEVCGVPLYLLVSFNVVLDLLMGCTSGAVRSGYYLSDTTMLHFRTLDWGMDPLRNVVVQFNFIRSKSAQPQEIVARSVTYVGFVGVLTGVRPDLSLSLNFRAIHNAATRGEQLRFYLHHLLVLLGFRQSISSVLRSYLFSEKGSVAKGLEIITEELSAKHTTAAYLILSNGNETVTMEKDLCTAVIRQSSSFIVTTNHDLNESLSKATTPASEIGGARAAGLADLIDESKDRMNCISKKWKSEVRRHQRANKHAADGDVKSDEEGVFISEAQVIRWLSAWPTTNECTHYAVVLSPRTGEVVWAHAYPELPK
jgi:beta subunit of N-acylethanolamine-hydrolyzing acid amidase